MSEETGLYDRIEIGGEQFRRWHTSSTLEVMQDGKWASIPYVAQRALVAASAAAYEDAAKIASSVGEKWDARGDGLNALSACEEAADAIRAKAKEITNT